MKTQVTDVCQRLLFGVTLAASLCGCQRNPETNGGFTNGPPPDLGSDKAAVRTDLAPTAPPKHESAPTENPASSPNSEK
jgi:hypothetical protein